jgi:hypothetical protein
MLGVGGLRRPERRIAKNAMQKYNATLTTVPHAAPVANVAQLIRRSQAPPQSAATLAKTLLIL